MLRVAGLAVAAAFTLSSSAFSQVCQGNSPFSFGHVRVGAGVETGGSTHAVDGELAVGAASGLFANGMVSNLQNDNASTSANAYAAGAGFAIDLKPQHGLQLCPEVGFEYQDGPTVNQGGTDFSIGTHAFTFGGTLGGVMSSGRNVDFIPFVEYTRWMSTATASAGGLSNSLDQNYNVATLGAGFVFRHRVTIRPAVVLPFGQNGGVVRYGVSAGYSLGGGRQ